MPPDPHDVAYNAWRSNPTPESLSQVVSALKPVVDHAVGAANASGDAIVAGRAQIMAAKAVQTYNPNAGAALPTWVTGQLRELGRVRRKIESPLGVPERAQLDAYRLHKGTQELKDKLGREPDTTELADHVGMPVKRIADVRRATRPVISEAAGLQAVQSVPEFSEEALSYMMPNIDSTDRMILEHKTGYGGREILAPKDIAAKLKLAPANLTRRSLRLAGQLAEIEDMLRSVHAPNS